jgi:RimJ/RimL family protein N-acetyltransferase
VIRVQAAPPEHHKWLAERAGLSLHSGFGAIEAIDDAGRIVGMVGYDGWLPGSVCLHIALEHPAALRHLIRAGFGVAFDAPPRGFGKAAAVATVLSTNKRSLKLVERLGFRHAYTGRDWGGPGVDFVYFEMRRNECRWLVQERKAA